jgi:hypothetical protein
MTEPPSRFELDLLHSILDEQREKYPALYAQLPFLGVRSRELTGVGGYVYFELPDDPKVPTEPGQPDVMLTANKTIEMDSPPSGMGFALDVTAGRLNFLELVTYGDEEWDGTVGRYEIVPI